MKFTMLWLFVLTVLLGLASYDAYATRKECKARIEALVAEQLHMRNELSAQSIRMVEDLEARMIAQK